MESICQCKLSDLMNKELIEGNVFLENTLGELTDLISSSNIIVLKCYEDVFKKEFILKGIGGFIIIGILMFELVFALIFIINDIAIIRKYLYNLTQYFMIYNSVQNKNSMKITNIMSELRKIIAPPKKKIQKK